MPIDLITSSGLGSLLGMRHALEPDHLTAVATILSEGHSTRRAAWLGVCWGLGHTLTLVLIAAAVMVLRIELPAMASEVFELGVALMLIGLGLRAILLAAKQGPNGPVHTHAHHGHVHSHQGAPAHVHIGTWTLARRPLLIGAFHGLAGSGALTALVLATLPSTAARLASIVLFGVGFALGMAMLSGLLGWPLARAGSRRGLARTISFVVGCVSMALGVFWGYFAVLAII